MSPAMDCPTSSWACHPARAAGKRWYAVLSDFHRPQDYDAKGNYDVMPASDSKDLAALRHVAMTIDIPNRVSTAMPRRLAM